MLLIPLIECKMFCTLKRDVMPDIRCCTGCCNGSCGLRGDYLVMGPVFFLMTFRKKYYLYCVDIFTQNNNQYYTNTGRVNYKTDVIANQ